MEKEKLKGEFKRFLKENDACCGFFLNITNKKAGGECSADKTLHDYLIETNVDNYVRAAFIFAATPGGKDYWYSVHKKWLEHIKSLRFGEKDGTYVQINDSDIATVEALHDLLLDAHGYSRNHPTLKRARLLTQKMYMAFKHKQYAVYEVKDIDIHGVALV